MRWYADNSELKGIRESDLPDILIFGGVAVGPDYEKALQDEIQAVKYKYCNYERAPVKWNFKDLRRVYERQGMKKVYDKLLESSNSWRREIFEGVRDIEFCIIIACIESNSLKRDKLIELRPALTRYVFSNGLMRYGLHVKESGPARAQVILDWPDGKDPSPFDIEYTAAYNRGSTHDRKVTYQCGRLSALNFSDSIVFTNMNHSCLMQFSDLLVGATREFIELAVGKRKAGLGVEVLKILSHRFRGEPDSIFGRGLSVASNDNRFKYNISKAIKEILQ